MKIGVCGGIERIKSASELGFDYMEPRFKSLALDSDEKYEAYKAELEKYNIKCEAANGFLPGEMKITGENVDYNSLSLYLDKGYKRAFELGIKVVVLGAGGARNLPDGYSYKKGIKEIITFVKDYAAPKAADYGIDFVFEPLCRYETNVINTIKEGAMLASAIDMPNVGTLGDIYHMYVEGDSYDEVKQLKGILRHAHISNPIPKRADIKRCYMENPREYDYKGFFDALKYIGCERISIEADTKDYDNDVIKAAKIMNMYK